MCSTRWNSFRSTTDALLMKYKLAIFDFDGTLADSFPFFVRTYNQLAAEYNIRSLDLSEASQLRHMGAREIMQFVGMPAWKLPMIAKRFTDLMKANTSGIRHFPQIPEVLETLASSGVELAVVSSNSQSNIASILPAETLKLFNHFECGSSIFGKAPRLKACVKALRFSAEQAIYIGDQTEDLEAARKAKTAFGAVAWGYASIEFLRRGEPDEVFEHVTDIARLAERR
jgi:phosphoglycolate phosphatase